MKFKHLFILVLFALPVTIYMSSCETTVTDPCENVACSATGGSLTTTGSVCTCDCVAGYEGDSCGTVSRDKFVGVYVANDVCDTAGTITGYSVTITAGSGGVTDVTITSDFSDDFFVNALTATIDGDVITISKQEPDSDNFFVVGTGTYVNGTITWSYTITEENSGTVVDMDSCTGTWVKQ